jgi:hypothetical protein
MTKRLEKKTFNEFYIRNLKPGARPYHVWDKKQDNFAVRVEPSGHKAWKVIYKFEGRKRDFTIGNVAAIGIADARKIASQIMVQVAQGRDPQAIKMAKRDPQPAMQDLPGCTALYRHFDKHGELLYVGISLSAVARLSQHRNKQWFSQIESVTVEKFATREEAEAAEFTAIREELPKFNIAGASDREEKLARKLSRLAREVHQPAPPPQPEVLPPGLLQDDEQLLTARQLAVWLGITEQWVKRQRLSGKGPLYVEHDGIVMYRVGDVKAWLDSCSVPPKQKQEAA